MAIFVVLRVSSDYGTVVVERLEDPEDEDGKYFLYLEQ